MVRHPNVLETHQKDTEAHPNGLELYQNDTRAYPNDSDPHPKDAGAHPMTPKGVHTDMHRLMETLIRNMLLLKNPKFMTLRHFDEVS